MTGALWLPGAERHPQTNGGTPAGGPPRAIWHITWDELGKGGKLPPFDNVSRYLISAGFCPHLMWDPWGGRIIQYYPADRSARAVRNLSGGVETNRMGKVCLQVEAWFSPGAVVGGNRYATLADTPCKNLDKIVSWMRSHGIKDRWPNGWPKWDGSSRNAVNWRTESGHYGHSQVPENDHDDPGPMPRNMFAGGSPTPPTPRPPAAQHPRWPGRFLTQPPIMRGDDVRTWQAQMRRRGWPIEVDGVYGPGSEEIARKFQREKGLPVDGIVGPATWDAAWTSKIT